MAIATDISVAANGDIRRTGNAHAGGSPGYYTVLELHRFLQDLADNSTETGDDLLSIVRTNPSDRSTDNIIEIVSPYNIDDDLAEYLYDGSIIQDGGNTIYDGIVNFGNTSFIQLVQNGVILDTNDYWNENGGLNPDSNAGISHRFLIKVREATGSPLVAADIDGRRILGLSRNYGLTYSEFPINGTTRGNNVLALSEQTDLNNATAAGTVATWTDITNVTQGYKTIDLSNGNGLKPYYSEWDLNSRAINQFYERAKWLTRQGTAETLYGIDAGLFRGITHQITVDGIASGPLSAFETLTWTGGSGQMLAVDSVSAPTEIWIQLLTGSAPANDVQLTGGTSGATVFVNVTVTGKTVSSVFVGQSTGSAIIGSYGLGIQSDDLVVADTVTPLVGVAQNPPNNQTFQVSSLVSGEDRVLVTANDGADEIDYNQLAAEADPASPTSDTNLAGATTLRVSTAIPSDTPSSGYIFALNSGTGSYDEIEYASWSGQVFTLAGSPANTLTNTIADVNNVFIAYINVLASGTTASFTAIYDVDRSLVVKVRDGDTTPIKPFKSPATFGSGGGTIAAIRTDDA